MSSERRRSPRIAILNRVHGHVASLDVAVTVREMSLGGLSLETNFPFPDGAVHEFRLTLGDGSYVEVKGKIMHSREAERDGSKIYITGVQFVDDEPIGGSTTVDGVIERIK